MSSALIRQTEGPSGIWNFSFRRWAAARLKMGADIAKLVADPAPFLLSFHSFTLTAVHRAQHLANY
jgi:hypothetical protein